MTPRLLKLRCDLCGSRLREGQYVYSRWTRHRYCWDLDACRARARRKKRRTSV